MKNINKKNQILSSTLFQAFIGIVLGGVILAALFTFLPFLNSQDETLPETGEEVVVDGDFQIRQVTSVSGEDVTYEYAVFVLGEGGIFESEKEVAIVGDEVLYGRDLNLEAWVDQVGRVEDQGVITKADMIRYLDNAVFDSKLLQVGASFNIVDPSENTFNTLNKDYKERNKLIDEIKLYFKENMVHTVDFEMISMWYFNMNEPKIGTESAKKIVKSKIDSIHSKVTKEGLSLLDAESLIKSDISLEEIDHAYTTNAYEKLENESVDEPSIAGEIVKQADILAIGEVSEVKESVFYNGKEELTGAYYYFIKKNNEKGSQESLNSWVVANFTKSVEIKIKLDNQAE